VIWGRNELSNIFGIALSIVTFFLILYRLWQVMRLLAFFNSKKKKKE
jgi:hypothetical protein